VSKKFIAGWCVMKESKVELKQYFSNVGIKMQDNFFFWDSLGIKYLGG
jgi:hypothetical protein